MRISIIVELPDLTPSSPTASAVMDELENAVRPALDAIGHYWWLDMEGGETRYAPEERELPCFQIGLWTGFNMTEWETLETIQVSDKLTAEKYAELHYPGVEWYIRPAPVDTADEEPSEWFPYITTIRYSSGHGDRDEAFRTKAEAIRYAESILPTIPKSCHITVERVEENSDEREEVWYGGDESGRCHEDCGCPHCGRDCEPGESQCGDSDCPRHDNA